MPTVRKQEHQKSCKKPETYRKGYFLIDQWYQMPSKGNITANVDRQNYFCRE